MKIWACFPFQNVCLSAKRDENKLECEGDSCCRQLVSTLLKIPGKGQNLKCFGFRISFFELLPNLNHELTFRVAY